MSSILIIDDNPTNRETFADILEEEGYTVLTAESGEEGLAMLTGAAVDAVLCDLRLPNLDGLATMELAHERIDGLPWVLITGHGNEELAVQAIKQGAFNYLTKPVDLQRLVATMASATRTAQTNKENQQMRRELGYDEALERIIGSSAAVKQLKTMIQQVAPSDTTVLIEGESGTGKELVADAIYHLSQRHGRPYVKRNTAAIPRELLESELFGHERGAFTGAVNQKKGSFEIADTGTIFLDEIGEMPLDSQVKLLRTLQDGSFQRIGGNEQMHTDVRLICATNRNLKQEVLAGNFRMDLFYRLNVLNIRVPSLRERREDIPLLANHFVEQLNKRHNQHKTISDDTLQLLRRRDWPGNIRELENTVEKLFVLASGKVIEPNPSLLDAEDPAFAAAAANPSPNIDTSTPSAPVANVVADDAIPPQQEGDCISGLVGLPLDEVEKRLILATLDHCQGNKSKAARVLHIGLKTLYRKLEQYTN